MNAVAQLSVGISALILIAVFALEAFLIDRPRVQKPRHLGTTVVVVSLIYMLLASLFMGVADLLGYWRPRGGSIKGTVASFILPAAALSRSPV